MTLGLASPTCGLMHDSALANTQANHSRWHAHKCLMNNTECVCHGLKVGAGFERREGGTGANRVRHGARARDGRHTQNGPEAHVVCGTRKGKRPTERGWALNFGGVVPRYRKPPCYPRRDTISTIIHHAGVRGAFGCSRTFPLTPGLLVTSSWNTDPRAHSFLDFLINRQCDPLTNLKSHA